MKMDDIKARGTLYGDKIEDIPVINPGNWFGKTWLLEIGGSYFPLFLVVEADTVSDAIDELAEHEKYGNLILVEDYLEDYPEEERYYSGSGAVLDLDHIMIHGQEGSKTPFQCVYYGENLPAEGIFPPNLDDYLSDDA